MTRARARSPRPDPAQLARDEKARRRLMVELEARRLRTMKLIEERCPKIPPSGAWSPPPGEGAATDGARSGFDV